MRTFAIVSASILLLLLLVAGAGWYWWNVNGKAIVASSLTAFDEGRRRGAAVDEAGCVAEVLERHRSDRDGKMSESIARGVWLNGCLDTSRIAASFCQGVPPADEMIKVTAWITEVCAQPGLSNPGCQSIYQEVAHYCASPRRAAKAASAPAS
jgi:hypothetical protein